MPAYRAGVIARTRLADEVYRHLREAIATGVLEDGSRILEEEVAAELGLSRTPVRQALYRLAADQLVDTRPGRSAVVKPLTHQDALDIVDTYWTLAHRAYELGAPKLTANDLTAIDATLDQATELIRNDTSRAYETVTVVNGRIYVAAANVEMVRMLGLLRPRLDRLLRVRHHADTAGATIARMRRQLEHLRAGRTADALAELDRGMGELREAVDRYWAVSAPTAPAEAAASAS